MFMIIVFWVICLNLCVNKGFVHTYSLPENVSFLKNIAAIVHSSHFPLTENQFKAEGVMAVPAAGASAASQASANQMASFNSS